MQQENETTPRRRFYLDPELQFPIIAALLLLTTLQGLFLGWGFYKAVVIARQWQRADQALDFFKVIVFIILPAVGLNIALGTYISHKIAGPLQQIRRLLGEISRGNLEAQISLRRGDLLQNYALECNRTAQTLKRLIYRDHQYSQEVNDLLTECEKWLAERQGLEAADKERLSKLIKEAKNRLSIINAHFMKGQWTSHGA